MITKVMKAAVAIAAAAVDGCANAAAAKGPFDAAADSAAAKDGNVSTFPSCASVRSCC